MLLLAQVAGLLIPDIAMVSSELHASFYLLCAFLGLVALSALVRRFAVLEFPTIAALLGIAWVVPQGIELEYDLKNIHANEAFWLYVTACFAALLIAFNFGKRRRAAGDPSHTRVSTTRVFVTSRLLIAAAGLNLLGLLALMLIFGTDTSEMGTEWTGVITLYALLSKASGFALCLSVLIFTRTKSVAALLIAVTAAAPLVFLAIYEVRREQIFDLVVLTFGAWYLAKARSPSPALVIAALVIGTVVINSAINFRNYVESGKGSLVGALITPETYTKFDYTDLEQGSASEVGLAQYDHWYMSKTRDWEYGAVYWNSLVNQYVPAFIVGHDTKERLRIESLYSQIKSGQIKGRFSLGSTRTGFSDSYLSFGLFGVFVFALIGYFFGYFFASALAGSLTAQYLYLVILAEGLKSITHSTSEFVAALPFTMLVSFFVFRFAQLGTRERRARPVLRLTPSPEKARV